MGLTARRRQADILNLARKIHRTTGALLFVFFFIIAITGLLLGWKKHTLGMILPHSHEGTSTDLKDWLPIDVLHQKAIDVVRDQVSDDLSLELERIDARPDKGMVKFVFIEGYWGVQLDGATGELLHIERRRSDFIENIHDGSIFDYLLGTTGEQVKLVYTSVMGTALLTFTISGFWLWYGPKKFKAGRKGKEVVPKDGGTFSKRSFTEIGRLPAIPMNMSEAKRSFEKNSNVNGGEDRNRSVGNLYSVEVDLSNQLNAPYSFGDFDDETLADPSDYCLSQEERFPD